MKIDDKQWKNILNYCRSKIIHSLSPESTFVENAKLRDELSVDHKGFYIGITDSSGNEVLQEGFLDEGLDNVLGSIDVVVPNIVNKIQAEDITISKIKTSTFHLNLVTDIVYIPDPMQWDENRDGVFFQWGQNYKALYLPYQIQKMNIPKIEIMDRLCCWEAGVVSSLWKLPEGLCWRVVVQYPSNFE